MKRRLRLSGTLALADSCELPIQVGYKAPVPASTSLICTASLDSLDGRKAWVSAQVLDKPSGTLYATGKALFVIPKVSKVAMPVSAILSQHLRGVIFNCSCQVGYHKELNTMSSMCATHWM